MEKLELVSNGVVIGFLAGLVLICKSIYDGTFNWWRTLMTVPATTIVGYSSYEVLSVTNAPYYAILILTIFISLNSFLSIEILTDKELMNKLFEKYIRKPILGDTGDKKIGNKDE